MTELFLKILFFIVHCPNKYYISDWFVTSKMIKKHFIALYVDENILYFNEDSGDVFDCNEMGILNTDINNTSLDNYFDEDDLDNIILIRILAWHIKFKKRKALKKTLNEELMPIVWHPNRWWNFSVPEDEKKDIEPTFTSSTSKRLTTQNIHFSKNLQMVASDPCKFH